MQKLKNILQGKKTFAIMEATPDDYPHIAHLHSASFARGWSETEIADLATQAGCICLIARQVGEPTGPVHGFNLVRYTAQEAEILSIAVHSKQRRAGLANSLMREAILRLQHDRVGALVLEVDNTNQPAVRLYEKLGFVTVGNRPGYYRQGEEKNFSEPATALIMRLDLF